MSPLPAEPAGEPALDMAAEGLGGGVWIHDCRRPVDVSGASSLCPDRGVAQWIRVLISKIFRRSAVQSSPLHNFCKLAKMSTFQGFKERIAMQSFDSDKINAVKTAAGARMLPFMVR